MAVNSNATTPCFPLQPSSDEAAAAAAARANAAAQAAEDATEDASQAASDANDAKDAADAAVEAVNAKLALVQTLEEIYGGAYVNEQVSGSTINITDGADNVPVKALSVAISGASPALTAVTINKTVNGLNTPYTMSLVSGGTQLSVTEGTLDFVNGVLVSGGVTYNIDGGGIDVPTSLGANAFTTSAGVMDMTYRADIDLYLQETYLALANLENAVVGNAKQLVATVGINDNAPYLFRTSGGTADIGDRETDELVGGTVAWNQLIDPITSATIQSTVSVTSVNGKYTISGTAASAGGRNVNLSKRTFPVVNGHKYAVISDFILNSFAPFITNDANTSEYFRVFSTKQIAEATFTGNARFGINVVANIEYNESGYINFVDLTLDFGSAIADHAYSLESATAGAGIAWLRKYGFFNKPYYPYNAGQLMSVKTSAHKMVGFNAFDISTKTNNKTLAWVNGQPSAENKSVVSDYIRVVCGNSYYCNYRTQWMFYDINKEYLGAYALNADAPVKATGTETNSITVPNGYSIAYVRLGIRTAQNGNQDITQKTDINLNLSWDGERDGEYAPYVEYNYPLDNDLELRGIAKLDANNNLYYDGDTYASDGTVTRKYGIVDLGTLNWTRSNNDGAWGEYYKFYAQVVGKAATLNMVNPKYENTTIGLASMGDKTIRISADYIYIRDDSYTSAAAFKTAMSGVYLVYELATPSTESADTYTNPQIVDDFGTEEYVDEREVPIPVGHNTIYSANLRAKLEMAPDSPDGDGDYIVRQTNGTNEYVPLPVSNVYQHNAVITLASDAGTVYLPYVSKLATAYNIVDIGNTDGAPTTTPIYPATGYYDSKAVVAVQFGSAPAITVYLADGTNASTTMTTLADTVG